MSESSARPARPALIADGISKSYVTRSGRLDVIADASFEVRAGESVAIMGPSGCGKSTLLAILGTLETPSTGRLIVGSNDPFTFDERRLAAFRNERLGFVFQHHHLLPQCTALENVLAPTLAGFSRESRIDRARELLRRVGLAERADHLPAELSGGERQRCAVARALINEPAIVLADEPTGSLDRSSADAVGNLLLELPRAERAAMIIVTHSDRLAAQFDTRYELVDGRLRPVGIEPAGAR
ncbi:MAG: ABC transporter ATP-binding protein [Phycisphaerales bacterium]|nr:ABC transporter ATP-binding protein [Phycisphaerales bacterium]